MQKKISYCQLYVVFINRIESLTEQKQDIKIDLETRKQMATKDTGIYPWMLLRGKCKITSPFLILLRVLNKVNS